MTAQTHSSAVFRVLFGFEAVAGNLYLGLMKQLIVLATLVFTLALFATEKPSEPDRLKQLDSYWADVSRAVASGDFAAYEATCHPEGVLVAGTKKKSEPLADALKRWKREFDDTRAGKMKANVQFKFSQRMGDATTAHETGMFLYQATDAEGKVVREYIHLEALLVKRDGKWKILMEYQKSKGTREQYEAI